MLQHIYRVRTSRTTIGIGQLTLLLNAPNPEHHRTGSKEGSEQTNVNEKINSLPVYLLQM